MTRGSSRDDFGFEGESINSLLSQLINSYIRKHSCPCQTSFPPFIYLKQKIYEENYFRNGCGRIGYCL